jgi:hypothetical protein
MRQHEIRFMVLYEGWCQMGEGEGVPRGVENLQLLVSVEEVHSGSLRIAEGDVPKDQFAELGPSTLDKTSGVCRVEGGPVDGKLFEIRTAVDEHVP